MLAAYLSHLDVGVFDGVGVRFDQLLHLPQVGFLDLLELLHPHHGKTQEDSHSAFNIS